jgi:replicative DNA helicase
MSHVDVDTERALIGCLLGGDQELIADAAATLLPTDFTDAACRAVWTTVAALEDRRATVDFVTVAAAMQEAGALGQIGGSAALTDLVSGAPAFSRGAAYLRVVRDLGVKRRLAEAGQKIAAVAGDADSAVAQAETLLREATAGRDTGSVVWLKDVLDGYVGDLTARVNDADPRPVVATGFADLDRALGGGLRGGELVILAARPSVGKSALAGNVLRRIAGTGRAALLFSLEMSAESIVERLLAAEARVDHQRLRQGFVSPDEWARIGRAFPVLCEARLAIDETPALSVAAMRATARRLAGQHDLACVAVDYLQLVGTPGHRGQREQAVAEVSRSLKALAKELGVPVLALSQLSREVEKREDKRPMLSDLRESGAIEQDADIVLFIHREEITNPKTDRRNVADLIVAKQRNGQTADIPLRFDGPHVRFTDLEVYRTPDYQGQETF